MELSESINGCHPALTSDERRCFSYFLTTTVPTMVAFYDSARWQQVVLRTSHSEPAALHALVALSAVQQDIDSNGERLPVTPGRKNTSHLFVFEQLRRSFFLLKKRSSSRDPQFKTVVLICCLLFITSDFLLGHYDISFKHLQSGLRLLSTGNLPKTSYGSLPVDQQCVVAMFKHLQAQSGYFGLGDATTSDEEDMGPLPQAQGLMVSLNNQETRQVVDPLTTAIIWSVTANSRSNASSPDRVLPERQAMLPPHIHRFAESFENFRLEKYQLLKPQEQTEADLMHLKVQCLILSVKTCHLPANDPAISEHTYDFMNVLSLAEVFTNGETNLLKVTLNSSVIPPLYLVANRCLDRAVYERAIEALLRCSHWEGPWDAKLLARIASELMELKLPVATEGLNESQRSNLAAEKLNPHNDFVMVSADYRYGRIPYKVGGTEREWSFTLDDERSRSSKTLKPNNSTLGWIRVIPSRLHLISHVLDERVPE